MEERVIEKLPALSEFVTDLEQLQQLLARCMELSKEMPKRDAEWARELLQQIRTELERQRREQRKALQQLITDIRELMEKISRWRRFRDARHRLSPPLSVDAHPRWRYVLTVKGGPRSTGPPCSRPIHRGLCAFLLGCPRAM